MSYFCSVLKSYDMRFIVTLLIIHVFSSISYHSAFYAQDIYRSALTNKEVFSKIDEVIGFGKTYLGKPYRHKTESGRVLDCSGFVSYIYNTVEISLPRSCSSILNLVEKVNLVDVEKGDLLFFKGRDISSSNVGHVAIVTSVISGEIEMMHSCNRGIILEKYNNNKYYTSRFLQIGRLSLPNPAQNSNVEQKDTSSSEVRVVPEPIIDKQTSSAVISSISRPSSIIITAVGDIMLGTNFPNASYLPPNDGKDILQPVAHIIKRGDIAFGNLEGVILTGEGSVKKCSDPQYCYAFKMPDHYANYLVDAGFNVLSIANNHLGDFGAKGRANTERILKEKNIHYAGLLECPYSIFEKKGVKFGFAAFSPNAGTVSMHNYANVKKIISHLDTICDIVIVSFHGGAEGAAYKHITRKKETFLGENRGNPYEFARMVIDAGADIVLGHGPHVTRAIDIYKGKFIAYSMGNFATYGRFSLSGPSGISPIFEIEVDLDGSFLHGQIHATRQLGRGGPVLDPDQKVIKELIYLTQKDIPESLLKIGRNGSVEKIME